MCSFKATILKLKVHFPDEFKEDTELLDTNSVHGQLYWDILKVAVLFPLSSIRMC